MGCPEDMGKLGSAPSTSYSAHWDTSEGFPHTGARKGQMQRMLKDWAERGSKWAARARTVPDAEHSL